MPARKIYRLCVKTVGDGILDVPMLYKSRNTTRRGLPMCSPANDVENFAPLVGDDDLGIPPNLRMPCGAPGSSPPTLRMLDKRNNTGVVPYTL